MKSSYTDEREFRESEVRRLKRRYEDLQVRLDKSYEDRLDRIIDERYWAEVSTKWRAEQDEVRVQINRFEQADRNYVDRGIKIIELDQRAYSLYVEQELSEKRKLLNCVLSNSTLNGPTLCPTYKKPFDMIAEGVKTQKWHPRQDSNLLPSA